MHGDLNSRLTDKARLALDKFEEEMLERIEFASEDVMENGKVRKQNLSDKTFGMQILHGYLSILKEPGSFLEAGRCLKHNKECPLPHTSCQRDNKCSSERPLVAAAAGTTCTDWSSFGLRRGLYGPSTRALAIWIAQRLLAQEDAARLPLPT